MRDLRDIKLLIDTLKQYSKYINFENKVLLDTSFHYFHVDTDICNEIKSSNDIYNDDTTFAKNDDTFPNEKFCTKSQFFRGCIKIKSLN